MIDGTQKYLITDKGKIQNYLGMEIKPGPNKGEFELRQSFLIRKAIDHVRLPKKMKGESTTTPIRRPLLYKDIKGLPRKHDWKYRASLVILSYLQDSNCPDIAMTAH